MLDFGEKGCFLELTLSVYVTQSASAAKYAISSMLMGGGKAYPSWYYILKIIAKLQHQEACDGFRNATLG